MLPLILVLQDPKKFFLTLYPFNITLLINVTPELYRFDETVHTFPLIKGLMTQNTI